MLNVNAQAQWVQADMIRFSFSDLVDGETVVAKMIPTGYTIIGGNVTVVQAFNSGTTATLEVGDEDEDDRYTDSAVDLTSVGSTALDVTGYQYAEPTGLTFKFAETGDAATEGEAFVVLQLIREGKADTNL